MQLHPALLNSLVQNAATPDRELTTTDQLFSGITGDFLRQLIQMAVPSVRSRTPTLKTEARRVENQILDGRVHAKLVSSHLTSYSYQPKGWKTSLSMEQSSAMVTELAPLVLYLQYVVKRGDLLIIEEPESHLHPSGQALLAVELARLLKSDVQVIVTTHSDWILDQFANLVRRSDLSDQSELDLLDAQEAIPREDFGAWLFSKSEGDQASEVMEVPLREDAGGFDTGYDETADALYNEWVRIGNKLASSDTE